MRDSRRSSNALGPRFVLAAVLPALWLGWLLVGAPERASSDRHRHGPALLVDTGGGPAILGEKPRPRPPMQASAWVAPVFAAPRTGLIVQRARPAHAPALSSLAHPLTVAPKTSPPARRHPG